VHQYIARRRPAHAAWPGATILYLNFRKAVAITALGTGAFMTDTPESTGPLQGIRVIDLTQAVLGPVATQILGDMGADVIKIETPAGDPMRLIGPTRGDRMALVHTSFNRNKRSIILDLKRPAAKEALMRLVETADVFVHNMRLAAAERLGITYEDIRARKPDIVYGAGVGYAKDGPNRDRPAYDDVIQGESGLAGLIERANGESRYVPMPIADKIVGTTLASSIAMALVHKERTGKGQEVIVPMLETMVAFNLLIHMWNGIHDEAEKGIGYPRMFMPDRRPYQTKDGHICLIAVTDDQWGRLLKALERPELIKEPRFAKLADRAENLSDLLTIVAEELLKRTTAEWRELFDAVDVPNGAANSLEDLLADPYLAEMDFFQRYEHPSAGPMVTTAIPVAYSETPGSFRYAPPRLGEHTDAVLSEVGFTAAEIEEIAGD